MYREPRQHRQSSTRHRAAVIGGGLVFFGNGTGAAIDNEVADDIPRVIRRTLDTFEPHSTIVIDGGSLEAVERGAKTLSDEGWQYSSVDAWTIFRAPEGERSVALGMRSHMNRLRHFRVMFDATTDPGKLAVILDRYHQATGNPWRGTPGMTAHNAIRLSWENDRYQPLWRAQRAPCSYAGPLTWKRDLNEREIEWGYVHTFDGNSAYLGSAITADLAWSDLHHVGIQPFDPALAGYWLLDIPNEILALSRDEGRPPLLPRKARDTCAWVTTPYAKLLLELATCDVIDSWTARAEYREDGSRIHPASSRILRKWGEHTRNALNATRDLHPAVADGVKATYTDAVSVFQREGGRIQRWDWGHTVIDLWRATMYRRILRVREEIGYWPVAIKTDSISYADSSPDPSILAAHVGAQPKAQRPRVLGKFHHEATVTAAEWIAQNTPKRQLAGVR